jgi:hypothetical protein
MGQSGERVWERIVISVSGRWSDPNAFRWRFVTPTPHVPCYRCHPKITTLKGTASTYNSLQVSAGCAFLNLLRPARVSCRRRAT